MRRRPTTPDDIRGRQSEECEGEEEDEEGGVEGQREQGEEEEKERRLLCSLDRRRLSEALRTTAGRTDGRTDARRASATATAEEAVAREERERACGAARWWMRLPSSVPSRSAQADALPQFGAGATVVG